MSKRKAMAVIVTILALAFLAWAVFAPRRSPIAGLSVRDVAEIERLVRDHQRPGSARREGVRRIFATIGKVVRRRSLPKDLEIARQPDGTVHVEATPWRGQPGDRAALYYLKKTAVGWKITLIHYSAWGTGGVQFPGGAISFTEPADVIEFTSATIVTPKIDNIRIPTPLSPPEPP
jgi:hypothetical protein